jgi:hypothetical protein
MASELPPSQPPPRGAPPPPDPPKDVPTLKELLWLPGYRLLIRLLGLRGAAIVVLLLIAGWQIVSHWESVKTLPVISSVVKWKSEDSLPHADPHRFAIALAHLEHDKDHHYEDLIIKDLMKNFASDSDERAVQILQFDRTISLKGFQPEEGEKAGHDQARKYLRISGADVLIWGVIHHIGGQSAPRLYWTGFVKLLRPRLSSGKRVPLPSPTHPLGSPLRARNFGPTLESIPHLFAVLRC